MVSLPLWQFPPLVSILSQLFPCMVGFVYEDQEQERGFIRICLHSYIFMWVHRLGKRGCRVGCMYICDPMTPKIVCPLLFSGWFAGMLRPFEACLPIHVRICFKSYEFIRICLRLWLWLWLRYLADTLVQSDFQNFRKHYTKQNDQFKIQSVNNNNNNEN